MASNRVEMSVGKNAVNGDHAGSDVAPSQNTKATGVNGEVKVPKSDFVRQHDELAPVRPRSPYTNGAAPAVPQRLPPRDDRTTQLPQELLEVLKSVPVESFVPMAPLISRSAQTCWIDLNTLIDQLSNIRLPPLRPDQDRLPNGNVNDHSQQNREKKILIWDYAKRHKDILVKLLVLLQSSKRSEEVRRTIALNFFLHAKRRAFNESTLILGNTMRDLVRAQIPNPDLYTAAQVLALGKVPSFPTLGYLQEPKMTAKQILNVLRRLNIVLCARMTAEEHVPTQMKSWRVHDGRVTFRVPQEFELDLSVMSESPDANFGVVGVRFDFSPAPIIPAVFQEEIARKVNSEMENTGLIGAYNILHELVLSHKLQTLRKQAADLMHGQWAGHLRTEMHRRTLVVHYWLKRPGPKSWLEIGIHSGRKRDSEGQLCETNSFLQLLWTCSGTRIEHHNIVMDLGFLNLENILHQVVAQHANKILGTIYDKMISIPIYEQAELELEQTSSLNHPHECQLSLQVSAAEELTISVESIGGFLTLAPVNDRTARLQYELARAKNVLDEISAKLLGLRCAMAETRILRCITHRGWEYLPGLRPSASEMREMFGTGTLRAAFFRRQNWTKDWMLVISQSGEGDHWWIVHQESDNFSSSISECLKTVPVHLEPKLTREYSDKLALYASTIICLQVYAHAFKLQNIRTVLPAPETFAAFAQPPKLVVNLEPAHGFTCLHPSITLSLANTNENSSDTVVVVSSWFSAQPEISQRLSSTELGDAISIDANAGRVTLSIPSKIGEAKVREIFSELRKIDDLLSCVELVQKSKSWTLRSLSLQFIDLVYFQTDAISLSLKLSLGNQESDIKAELLPIDLNPHNIIAPRIAQVLKSGEGSLKARLQRLLTVLHMSLPLVWALQYLQSNKDTLPPPGEMNFNKSDSADWLRIHVMARDTTRFGLHFFSTTDKFKRDIKDNETPKKLLARFEIEPRPGKDGTRLGWILRPAIAELQTYMRPSFTSQELLKRLEDKVFENTGAKGWLALDKAAGCRTDEPYVLLSAIHDLVLEWLKENAEMEASASNSNNNSVPQAAGVNPNASSGKSNALNQSNQSSRVMTAPPQQVRTGSVTQQQRNSMQPTQQRNNKTNNREIITLD